MNPYGGSFYLMVGVLSMLIAHRIQDWLIRRKFNKFFGHRGVSQPNEEKIDLTMRSIAVLLNTFNRQQRRSARAVFAMMSDMLDIVDQPETTRTAKVSLKLLLAASRRWRRLARREKRAFRRGQKLAKHFGYKVWNDHAKYILGGELDHQPDGRKRGAYWPEGDRFPYGTRVVTTEDAGGTDWTAEGRAKRRWGMRGVVDDRSDSHGLCYRVRHEDGSTAWYDPSELSHKPVSALGFVNG